MAKRGVVFLTVLLLAPLAVAQSMQGSVNLKVVTEEVDPEPVEPGQDLTVKIRIHNEGGNAAEQVSVKLFLDYPFYVKTDSKNWGEFENICAGCSKDNTYYLTIDSGAVSGIYPIRVEISEKGSTISNTETINVQVRGVPDIMFVAERISAKVRPNEEFSADLTFRNIGTGNARKVKVESSSDLFVKLGAGMSLIGELRAGQNANLSLTFFVSEDAEPNTYRLPIQISFLDEKGQEYSVVQDFGVVVAHNAVMSIQNLKAPLDIYENRGFELMFRVENTGSGDARDVRAAVMGDFEGITESFLGKLEKGSDRPAVFHLVPKSSGEVALDIRVHYFDDFGGHVLEKSTVINVKRRLINFWTVSFALVVAGLAVSFLRRRSA